LYGGNTRLVIWEGGQVYMMRDQEPGDQCWKSETKVHIYIFAWNFLCSVSLFFVWMGKEAVDN